MTLASLSQHPGEHCRSYGREKHALPASLPFRRRRAGGPGRSRRRDPAAAVMRRGSAALHRQGRLIEIELLELVALSLVIGSLAEIDERAQLGPRQVHEVGIAPAPLRPFPGGPPGFDVLLELEHDFSRQSL